MNREIKFRAWDNVEKTMHYTDAGDDDGLDIRFNPLEAYRVSYQPSLSGGQVVDGDGFVEIEDFELMQYTGLKDKNGVEVYEGDILAKNPRYKYKVAYKEKWGKFLLKATYWSDRNTRERPIYLSIQKVGDMEVIGNIHENPELLKD